MLKSIFNFLVSTRHLIVVALVCLGGVLNAKNVSHSYMNHKSNWSSKQQNALIMPIPLNTCEVYYFRNGTTICHDSYGWYVRVPNRDTMAYGSNWGKSEVFYREGFTDSDVTRHDTPKTCECTK
jgi:hypothetical protein